MPTYTIEAVTGINEWSGQHGPMKTYKLTLAGHGPAELNQKPETAAPQPGQQIEGDLIPGKEGYPPKLKKTPPQRGGGGGGGKTKADQESIERSVAYKGAVELTAGFKMSDPELVEGMVERFFEHGLKLLHGELPAPAPTPAPPERDHSAAEIGAEIAVPMDSIRAAYKAWAKEQESDEKARQLFANYLVTLGVENPEQATADERRRIADFLSVSMPFN